MFLPDIEPRDFDRRFRLEPTRWRDAVVDVCAEHGVAATSIVAFKEGSNLVARVNEEWVAKIFPPFHRHQWESERRLLPHFAGHLPVAVPDLIGEGEREGGWTYVVTTHLPGELLEAAWPRLDEGTRGELMLEIGVVMASAHRIPVGALATLPPPWPEFLARQVEGCRARHARLGMPAWVVDGVDAFVAAALPWIRAQPATSLLTGEYTPFNLLVQPAAPRGRPTLTGMFDFGDAMIGPRAYDLVGPSTFLGGGVPSRVRALLRGFGDETVTDDPAARRGLLALLLLHRYSHLDLQVRIPAWQGRVQSLDDLAALIWP